jgi:hypothetical protein
MRNNLVEKEVYQEQELPEGLSARVMLGIKKEERKIVFKNTVLFSVLFVGSALAFIPVFKILKQDLIQSGFLDFLSLLISDPIAMFNIWKEFMLSLLESLPVVSVMMFITVVLVFLGSLRFVVRDLIVVFKSSHYKVIN